MKDNNQVRFDSHILKSKLLLELNSQKLVASRNRSLFRTDHYFTKKEILSLEHRIFCTNGCPKLYLRRSWNHE